MRHILLLPVSALLCGALLLTPVDARAEAGGCVKYGAAGAVAGHAVGHGVKGAVAGCVTGMVVRHQARKAARAKAAADAGAASGTNGSGGAMTTGGTPALTH